MDDLLSQLRGIVHGLDEQPPSAQHQPIGASQIRSARSSLEEARGHLLLADRATTLTTEHHRSIVASAASLRKAAKELDHLAAGVQEHLDTGFSVWRSTPTKDTPIL